MKRTGLLLGAGASYEIGMPLAQELTDELKNWLTPAKLRSLNDGWREQGLGHSDRAIDGLADILLREDMTYEHIIGHLQVEQARENSQEHHGLIVFLLEMLYHLLEQRHVLNVSFIARAIRNLDGLRRFAEMHKPLWVLSLNHDLIVECFSAYSGVPLKCGYDEERVRLPRRDATGTEVGDVEALVMRREQLREHRLPFFEAGNFGINLLKIHGSLDEFAFNDGEDLLKLAPAEASVDGALTALGALNREVRYVDPGWPGGVVRGANEIIYEDTEGEMQFLRRSLLGGVFKFQRQHPQTVPEELLSYFVSTLNQLSTLICIGYGFGDTHVNQAIREWLERTAERKLTIVDPMIRGVPDSLLHLSPQITLEAMKATDYLDREGDVVRSRQEQLEREMSSIIRADRARGKVMLEEWRERVMADLTDRAVELLAGLPRKGDTVDLDGLGISNEALPDWVREQLQMPSTEELLEMFLEQATGSHD